MAHFNTQKNVCPSNKFNEIFFHDEKSVLRSYDSPYDGNNLDKEFKWCYKYTYNNEKSKSAHADRGYTEGTASSVKVKENPNASDERYATSCYLQIDNRNYEC